MDDGTEVIIAAGDLFSIPAGHNSWVLGDEEYVSFHFIGARDYAARSLDDPYTTSGTQLLAEDW